MRRISITTEVIQLVGVGCSVGVFSVVVVLNQSVVSTVTLHQMIDYVRDLPIIMNCSLVLRDECSPQLCTRLGNELGTS